MKSLSHVWLFATPWTAAYKAPPSMGFSRQEYWNGMPLLPYGKMDGPSLHVSPSLLDFLPIQVPAAREAELLVPSSRFSSGSISYIVSIVSMCPSQSPNSSHSLPSWHPYICSICLCLYYALQIGPSVPFFLIPHICINILMGCEGMAETAYLEKKLLPGEACKTLTDWQWPWHLALPKALSLHGAFHAEGFLIFYWSRLGGYYYSNLFFFFREVIEV